MLVIVYLKNKGKEKKIPIPKKHGSYLISFLSGFLKLFFSFLLLFKKMSNST